MTDLNAEELARLCLHDPNNLNIQLSQTKHRIQLLSHFPIHPGSRVLEIGCGQGDCTAVLAELVGDSGHVTAIDPADLTYGAPYTLGQSQAHLISSRLGPRIKFVRADPIDFLSGQPEEHRYDVAVLAHCIWYFSSPAVISDIFRALVKWVWYVCVAEHSLSAGELAQVPHVLAVLAQASLEVHKGVSESNVRTVVSARQVQALGEGVGLEVVGEVKMVRPERGLLDGKWEVMAVLSGGFEEEVGEVEGVRERAGILAQAEAVRVAVEGVGGMGEVRTMDTYCVVFKGEGNSG